MYKKCLNFIKKSEKQYKTNSIKNPIKYQDEQTALHKFTKSNITLMQRRIRINISHPPVNNCIQFKIHRQ